MYVKFQYFINILLGQIVEILINLLYFIYSYISYGYKVDYIFI